MGLMKTGFAFRSRVLDRFFRTIPAIILFLSVTTNLQAQENRQVVRLAKITVDSTQLEGYLYALKEQMNTAILKEPGVLTYYAVSDKADPARITILEIYADTAAYQLHIRTPHFLKYKKTVQHMVKSLELVDVNLIEKVRKRDQ